MGHFTHIGSVSCWTDFDKIWSGGRIANVVICAKFCENQTVCS